MQLFCEHKEVIENVQINQTLKTFKGLTQLFYS